MHALANSDTAQRASQVVDQAANVIEIVKQSLNYKNPKASKQFLIRELDKQFGGAWLFYIDKNADVPAGIVG